MTPLIAPRLTTEKLFAGLAVVVPRLLDEEFGRRDLCIIGTKLCVTAGEYFGVDVRPMATLVRAVNMEFIDFCGTRARFPEGDEFKIHGLYSVGCDGKTAPHENGWPCHLIATSGTFAIDTTAGQYERKHFGIVPPRALIFGLDPDAPVYHVDLPIGALVSYQPVADERYLTSPDWKKNAPGLGGKLIRRLRKVL